MRMSWTTLWTAHQIKKKMVVCMILWYDPEHVVHVCMYDPDLCMILSHLTLMQCSPEYRYDVLKAEFDRLKVALCNDSCVLL